MGVRLKNPGPFLGRTEGQRGSRLGDPSSVMDVGTARVSVSFLGLCHETPRTGLPTQQPSVVSWLWRPRSRPRCGQGWFLLEALGPPACLSCFWRPGQSLVLLALWLPSLLSPPGSSSPP